MQTVPVWALKKHQEIPLQCISPNHKRVVNEPCQVLVLINPKQQGKVHFTVLAQGGTALVVEGALMLLGTHLFKKHFFVLM